MTEIAHVGGFPIEETLGMYGPALLLAAGAASASLKARLRRLGGDRGGNRHLRSPARDRAARRGSSYAVATGSIGSRELGNNAVRAADLKNNDIRTRDVRNGTLAGVDVRDDALTGADVGKSTLQTVPSANTAHRADAADTAGRADHAESANVATNIAAPEGFHEIGAAVEPSSTRAVRTPFPRSCRSAFARTTNASFTSAAATPVPTPARQRSTSRPSTGPRAARSTPRLACFGGDQCPDSLTAAVNTFGAGVVPGADGGVTAVATEVSLDGVSSRAAGCRNVSTTGRNAVRPECPWIV